MRPYCSGWSGPNSDLFLQRSGWPDFRTLAPIPADCHPVAAVVRDSAFLFPAGWFAMRHAYWLASGAHPAMTDLPVAAPAADRQAPASWPARPHTAFPPGETVVNSPCPAPAGDVILHGLHPAPTPDVQHLPGPCLADARGRFHAACCPAAAATAPAESWPAAAPSTMPPAKKCQLRPITAPRFQVSTV